MTDKERPVAWTRSEIQNLGRPLTKFDECPHCGTTAAAHLFDRQSESLFCPATYGKVSGPKAVKAARDFRFEETKRADALQRQLNALESARNESSRQPMRAFIDEFSDEVYYTKPTRQRQRASPEMKPKQPTIATDPSRKYFDE